MAIPSDPVNLRRVFEEFLAAMAEGSLKWPPMYRGWPVDLSNLDTPVSGYEIKSKKKKSSEKS